MSLPPGFYIETSPPLMQPKKPPWCLPSTRFQHPEVMASMGPGRRQRFLQTRSFHFAPRRSPYLVWETLPCSPRARPARTPYSAQCCRTTGEMPTTGQNNGGAVARTPDRDYIHVHGSTQQALSEGPEGERPTCPCKKCKNAKSITRLALPSAASGA